MKIIRAGATTGYYSFDINEEFNDSLSKKDKRFFSAYDGETNSI